MKWAVLTALALMGITLAWATLPVREWLIVAVNRIDALGNPGIVVYFLVYFCLASASFPTTPLNIGAGLIFHLMTGFIIAWLAGGLASMATFLFSRYLAKDWARKKLETFPRCEKVVEAMERQGIIMVLLARLNPFIPASIKNFGFGVTAIPFWKYSGATFLGQLPIVLAYVYLGWAGSATLLENNQPEAINYVFIAVGVLLSIAMLVIVNWYGNKALKDDSSDPEHVND